MTLNDQLRRAIRKSGMSFNSIATAAGLAERTLSRFVNSGGDIYMDSASKIAAYLGMKFTPPKKPKRVTKSKG
jgi:DNA transposition AAA+ family ATPase